MFSYKYEINLNHNVWIAAKLEGIQENDLYCFIYDENNHIAVKQEAIRMIDSSWSVNENEGNFIVGADVEYQIKINHWVEAKITNKKGAFYSIDYFLISENNERRINKISKIVRKSQLRKIEYKY